MGRTTLIVPMRMFGGVALLLIITLMNLAVMPMMAMREQAWKSRASWKVAPRAPLRGNMLILVVLMELELGGLEGWVESRGRVERCTQGIDAVIILQMNNGRDLGECEERSG